MWILLCSKTYFTGFTTHSILHYLAVNYPKIPRQNRIVRICFYTFFFLLLLTCYTNASCLQNPIVVTKHKYVGKVRYNIYVVASLNLDLNSTKLWRAKMEFNAYFLILKNHFLILEIQFLILENELLILENEFLISENTNF